MWSGQSSVTNEQGKFQLNLSSGLNNEPVKGVMTKDVLVMGGTLSIRFHYKATSSHTSVETNTTVFFLVGLLFNLRGSQIDIL